MLENVSQNTERSFELSRPLAVLDVQSTGLDPSSARIVKLSVYRVDPDGSEHVKSVLVNPEMTIPPGSTQVHGITDLDVMDKPVFRAYANALADHLGGCDLAGFGIERFGLPLLQAEFDRAGVEFDVVGRAVVDAMTIFHRLEPRNLASAYSRFVGGVKPELSDEAQGAQNVFAILQGELRSSLEVPTNPGELAAWAKGIDDTAIDAEGKFIWSEEGDALINFGKHRGERLIEVVRNDKPYLNWVSGSDDFDPEVRKIAESALNGHLPERSPESMAAPERAETT
ncbi:MAG: exonuclease domain-containing protein [Dehalococcoidia bacterium]|jgi:DNA polymerase-3 subunit epsilon|nr:DNA polymerase III subunit epsilon [Chloroflexota bacterium]MDP7486056.1 exonuclease domain-containing protein [Dehalococcoidia bacterium]|tara:strand:+ start:3100 stop:3951 length:852 start_codon:yes stop_codon:yes gene_type:complete